MSRRLFLALTFGQEADDVSQGEAEEERTEDGQGNQLPRVLVRVDHEQPVVDPQVTQR